LASSSRGTPPRKWPSRTTACRFTKFGIQEYERSESDSIKYEYFLRALRSSFKKQAAKLKPGQDLNVIALGVGRGFIINVILHAADQPDGHKDDPAIPVKVYAVEKDANAFISLKAYPVMFAENGQTIWPKVTIIHADPATWQPPIEFDVLVADLLGPFGDDRMLPEALCNVSRYVRETGDIIPKSFSSFLSPVSAPKLHREASLAGTDSPYEVESHGIATLADSQPCMAFRVTPPTGLDPVGVRRPHPVRLAEPRFVTPSGGAVHALLGTFEATLYDDIRLSTRPENATPGLCAWSWVLFPLQRVVEVKAGGVVGASVWRRTDATRMWYEWCLSEPFATEIQNPNGETCAVKLHE